MIYDKNEWWELEGDEQAKKIFALVKQIEERNTTVYNSNLRHMRLYSGSQLMGITLSQYALVNNPVFGNLGRSNIGLNVIQACIDTAVNNLCQTRIKPMALTQGGSFYMQARAKKLNRFMEGMFIKEAVHEKTTMAIKNSGIFGTGFIKVFPQENGIQVDNIFPNEICVCPADGVYGEPRSIYHTKYVSRYGLIKAYPEKEAKIKGLGTETVFVGSGQSITDCVRVIEAYHLPSNSQSDDGKHVICLDGVELFAEEWKKDRFPFAKFKYTPMPIGYFGRGVAEELTNIQYEINQLLQRASQMMRLMAVPRVWVEEASQFDEDQFNNAIGGIYKYRGQAPVISTVQSVSPEIFQQIERLYAKAYELQGISQLAAGGKKPAGIDSGKAIREYSDEASTRLITLSQAREDFSIDVAKLMIEAAGDMAKAYGNKYQVVSYDKKQGVEKLTYKDVSLKPDDYILQVWPTNFLSKSPSGRLADIQELLQAGMLPRAAAQDLLDFPDLEGYMDLALSGYQLAKKNIEKMLDEGLYIPPESTDDLDSSESLAIQYLAKAKLMDDAEDELNLLRQYIEDVRNIKKSLMPPPPPVQQQVPAAVSMDPTLAPPIAMPKAAPTSPLLPIAS